MVPMERLKQVLEMESPLSPLQPWLTLPSREQKPLSLPFVHTRGNQDGRGDSSTVKVPKRKDVGKRLLSGEAHLCAGTQSSKTYMCVLYLRILKKVSKSREIFITIKSFLTIKS